VTDHEALCDVLDAVVPTLAGRDEPLVLAVVIDADRDYQP
jgi:hypothetical protein